MTVKLHVKELNTLLKLEPELGTNDERTLSVYMPVRAEGFDVRHYDVTLEHATGPYRRKLDDDQKKVLDRELPRFRTQLHLMRPAGCPAIASYLMATPRPPTSSSKLRVRLPSTCLRCSTAPTRAGRSDA